MKSENNRAIYRKDYQQPNYWIKSVNLGLMIEPQFTLVKSKIQFIHNSNNTDTCLILNGVDLELLKISVNGRDLNPDEYSIDKESLTIENVPVQFELQVENKIYPSKNTALEGLYQSGDFFLTQCEAEGFRKITYYPDRPDVMAPFDVTMVANKDKYPVLLCNGNLTASGDLKNGKHYARWSDPHPKPSYLFATVAGQLSFIEENYLTSEGKNVVLRIYVEEENLDSCQYAMDSLIRSMKWDEQRYGLAFDLSQYNIVATNDFNMGAMENKGLNIFNSKYVLARPETATDSDFIGVEAVIGHEYFHNWTGNRVTCQDWFQLSLKEGLTVFRDQEFTADMQSAAVKRIEDVRMLKAMQFAEDSGPMSHPIRPDSFIEINNFYTLTVYEKGAEVVRMYQSLLGKDGFRKGMDLYFKRHDGQAVTCDDFRIAMADANDYDLAQFELWYSQNGTPNITVKEKYKEKSGKYKLTIKQKAPDNIDKKDYKAMHIPMRMALFDKAGKQLILDEAGATEKVLDLKNKKHKFVFKNISTKPIASLFRGFSAPVVVKFPRPNEELLKLMVFDTDSYNRWDATQIMSSTVIMNAYEAMSKGKDASCPDYYIEAISHILTDSTTAPALLAEALSLPELRTLMTSMEDIKIDVLHQAKEFIKKAVANALEIEFLSVYNQNFVEGAYKVESADVAKRSLKNTCLSYLMCTSNPDIQRLCKQQYDNANNMTDSFHALAIYVHHSAEGHNDMLMAFYDKWQGSALVLDKWFSLQATSPAFGTLDNVIRLLNHESFSLENPNKVRSLIGAFAAANLLHFHQNSGKGYTFLADQVIALNKFNPQIASRMVSYFNNWKKFDKPRRELIQQQLKRIHGTKSLSSDVFEIVDKALSTS
ncbi:MAG: aminopeptidase N [Alcanivoracaceae bacterium]|nr:aminopeptidase N [Alcanivoracaceae bacterium]